MYPSYICVAFIVTTISKFCVFSVDILIHFIFSLNLLKKKINDFFDNWKLFGQVHKRLVLIVYVRRECSDNPVLLADANVR